MRHSAILFLLLCLISKDLPALTNADSLQFEFTRISGRCLNYNCVENMDSALAIVSKVEKEAARNQHLSVKFKTMQTIANLHYLKGEIALGTEMAKNMYEEAKSRSYSFGIALSVQATGAAFMRAGQFKQAEESFAEAELLIDESGDMLSQMQLYIQQLHNFMKQEDTTALALLLSKAKPLLASLDRELQPDYTFYLACYESIYLSLSNRPDEARQQLAVCLALEPQEGSFSNWSNYAQQVYHVKMGDYSTALAYCDSIEHSVSRRLDIQEYKNTLILKAQLLELVERTDDACTLYQRINALTDSLNALHYTEQINALRLTYLVDQMEIEDARERSGFLLEILYYAIVITLVVLLLIFITRKRNKRLIKSRKQLADMREAAADSIRSKSMFLSNMSHDLRTPLNAIVGFSQVLTEPDEILDAEIKQQCRDSIKQNSDLLLKLINDIVDLSNLNGGSIKFDFTQCDAVALCSNVIETIKSVKETQAELSFQTELKFLEIETDSARLQQVLINLLVNATKFTRQGYIKLILEVDETNREARFTVEDTGCGIPLDRQAKIFERFEKLHRTAQGVGLGLSICRLIVEQVNGRIWIDSEYTQGTRFLFTHPLKHPTEVK